jgi:hypothetical protein
MRGFFIRPTYHKGLAEDQLHMHESRRLPRRRGLISASPDLRPFIPSAFLAQSCGGAEVAEEEEEEEEEEEAKEEVESSSPRRKPIGSVYNVQGSDTRTAP